MPCRRFVLSLFASFLALAALHGQQPPQSSSRPPSPVSSAQQTRSQAKSGSKLDDGTLKDGVYTNREFGFTCVVPSGWVLRTAEMNTRDETASADNQRKSDSRVLLSAFSRPPEAVAEDVNSSILIAAEPVASYPGLKEAVQYLAKVSEIATSRGFSEQRDPYEIAVGSRTLVRQDFQKDVGSRLMRQSTLVMLAHGYAVSFTFIAGTQQELDDLIEGLNFVASTNIKK